MSINDEQQTTVVPDSAPTEYFELADGGGRAPGKTVLLSVFF